MTEEELLKRADELVASFCELDVVKRYREVKKTLAQNKRLCSLQQERKAIQSHLKEIKTLEKDALIKRCKELQIEYDNDPLVINYKHLKEEVFALIQPLEEAGF